MALNSSCQPILSCEDSALSITGSLIGILTLAYAIFITVLYRTQELGNANEDIQRIARRIQREFLSLRSSFGWAEDLRDSIDMPDEFWRVADGLLKEADATFNNSLKLLIPSVGRDHRIWRVWVQRGRFLSRKADIQQDLDDMLRIRSSMDAICQETANRIMLHRFQKQSETLEAYAESIENQRAMLRRVMNVLHLDAMEESSGKHPDDSDITMRPPTR